MAGAVTPSDGEAAAASTSPDDSAPSLSSSAKRPRTTSSRGVANLTPDQLARKRANDREAQRAIRERTRKQIDLLNQRIRELENQQPYHDLQLVVREKDAIAAENQDLRNRLETIMSLIQPVLQPPPQAALHDTGKPPTRLRGTVHKSERRRRIKELILTRESSRTGSCRFGRPRRSIRSDAAPLPFCSPPQPQPPRRPRPASQ